MVHQARLGEARPALAARRRLPRRPPPLCSRSHSRADTAPPLSPQLGFGALIFKAWANPAQNQKVASSANAAVANIRQRARRMTLGAGELLRNVKPANKDL